MRKLATLLFGMTILSCNQSNTSQVKIITQDTLNKTVKSKIIEPDSVSELLNKALKTDTLEFKEDFATSKSFLFFKSGHIISKTEKNALVVHCPTDTTYAVRLYSNQGNKWIISDSISGLDAFPIQFETNFDDYNFDGQTDLYIQVSASNGWSLSMGHLLIIDPTTKKFDLHKEARNFANMKIDKMTKTVKTEMWNGFNNKGKNKLTIYTNKWVNDKLKIKSKENVIIP